MPSKKGIDQALIWLKNKAKEKENSLDAVNAELCINVIMDLQRQYDRLGAQFNNLRNSRYSGNAAEMREEQITFLDESLNVSVPEPHPRTTNIPLNRKGDVHNEKTRTETTGVRDRKPDR